MKPGTRPGDGEVGGQAVVRNGLGRKVLAEPRLEGVKELVVWFGRKSVQGRAITSQCRDPKRERSRTSKESGVAGRGAGRGQRG